MQPPLVDRPVTIPLDALLEELAREEEEAERALRAAQLRLAHIRGQRAGILRAVEFTQQAMRPVQSNGVMES